MRGGLLCGGLALVAALAAVPGTAPAQTPTPSRERFNAADKNHDRKLDREEFYVLIVERFYFRDKDKKGYLTVDELRETSPEAFKAANRKGDGRLTLQEYVNALFIDFDNSDVNKDGMLTFEEIEAYRSRATK